MVQYNLRKKVLTKTFSSPIGTIFYVIKWKYNISNRRKFTNQHQCSFIQSITWRNNSICKHFKNQNFIFLIRRFHTLNSKTNTFGWTREKTKTQPKWTIILQKIFTKTSRRNKFTQRNKLTDLFDKIRHIIFLNKELPSKNRTGCESS